MQTTGLVLAIDEKTQLQRLGNALTMQHRQLVLRKASEEALESSADAMRYFLRRLRAAPPSQRHSEHEWLCCAMSANVYDALGQPRKAIRWEEKGLAVAKSDANKGKSHNNLSDHYRRLSRASRTEVERLNRLQFAVDHARQAYQFLPQNVGVIVNLAMALGAAGHVDEANEIVRAASMLSDVNDPSDVLAAHILLEQELLDLNLESVREMKLRVDSVLQRRD